MEGKLTTTLSPGQSNFLGQSVSFLQQDASLGLQGRSGILSQVVAKTLHIVDGESNGSTLRLAGFRKNGEILLWRDAL